MRHLAGVMAEEENDSRRTLIVDSRERFVMCRSIRLFVELGIESIEVAAVKLILYDPQAFAEPLVVYDLALPQEADRIAHLRVFDEPEDIVVGRPGFLLGG